MGRDNAGQRILSPRRTTDGHVDSLTNTFGETLLDGAQCFVVQEEANYRFLRRSLLHSDGKFVVAPVDNAGRWVREQGLCGFALLDGGTPGEDLVLRGYTKQQLVQFALSGDGRLVYTGAVPRLAHVGARTTGGARPAVTLAGEHKTIFLPGADEQVSAFATLRPGDTLALTLTSVPEQPLHGSLEITLS